MLLVLRNTPYGEAAAPPYGPPHRHATPRKDTGDETRGTGRAAGRSDHAPDALRGLPPKILETLATVADQAAERGPWVLSPAQLGVLTRAMDVRNALPPSAARQYPGFAAEIRAAHTRSRHPRAM